MYAKKPENHVYIIKQRRQIELADGPHEYEELIGKCTSADEVKKILASHPGAYVSDDSVYKENDLFFYQ
jgi:hypothetical protein